MPRPPARLLLALISTAAASCVGTLGDADPAAGGPGGSGPGGGPNGGPGGGGGPSPMAGFGTGLRRLTKAELRATIKDLLFVDPIADLLLLAEEPAPFDNDYAQQVADQRFVESIATIVEDAATTAMESAVSHDKLIRCASPDAACLAQFVTDFGRRALRRHLDPAEIDELKTLAATQTDFHEGIKLVIRALLQDAEFLYRIEIGVRTDKPNVFRLTSWEVASRLSYLLWGTAPGDDLLALANRDGLKTPDQVRTVAKNMLDGTLGGAVWKQRARDRVTRFHGMWLGFEYTTPETTPMGKKMRAETGALLERTIFTKHTSWFDIFRSKDTFVDRTLAEYYGDMTKTSSNTGVWVPYGSSKRRGILSHGSFLSVANGTTGETSLTLRGKNIRNRLLCQEISPPPPGLMIDTTKPPQPNPGECRVDAINRTTLRQNSPCVLCHNQMDPIGFGLENFDIEGKYRATDAGRPNCAIAGNGKLQTEDPAGASVLETFQGPGGLGDMLVTHESARLEACLVNHFLRFAVGRKVLPAEAGLVDSYMKTFEDSGQLFDELLLAYTAAPEFGFRFVE